MSVDEISRLVVCLGNPGDKYARTRHNAGFMVADFLVEKFDRKWQQENNMLCCSFTDWLLVKPQTFMNNSGEVFDYLPEVSVDNILIVVDEVNLPLGRIRLRADGSAGGHNGLTSVEYFLQSREYCRLRVGVGSGAEITRGELIDFVLGEFTSGEMAYLPKVVELSARAVESWISRGVKITQDEFNRIDAGVDV